MIPNPCEIINGHFDPNQEHQNFCSSGATQHYIGDKFISPSIATPNYDEDPLTVPMVPNPCEIINGNFDPNQEHQNFYSSGATQHYIGDKLIGPSIATPNYDEDPLTMPMVPNPCEIINGNFDPNQEHQNFCSSGATQHYIGDKLIGPSIATPNYDEDSLIVPIIPNPCEIINGMLFKFVNLINTILYEFLLLGA
ncbi:hypothetical protein CFP56_033292 [Quercus suber]|uniref:Uncharacterized protein n=1 Tax=Quercus suber TaxID=58331 RepID=A0AAW0M9X3_QUESU